ncbi:MAG: hypothetical protein DRP30_00775 [Thermotoga sp.]|nr:MAG: hypothetical protein DRP30_00775 [Thermotoga sp.]
MYNLIKRYLVVVDSPRMKITDEEIEKLRDTEKKKERDEIILSAKRKAEEIIDSASKRAEEIIESATREAENIRNEILKMREAEMEKLENARKKFENEMKERMEKLERDYEERLKVIERMIEGFKSREDEMMMEILNIMVRFSKEFLKKMLLKVDEDVVNRRLRWIVDQIKTKRKIHIRLSAKDREKLDERLLDELEKKFEEISISYDDSLKCGDVVVETDFGNLDMTFEDGIEILEEVKDEKS